MSVDTLLIIYSYYGMYRRKIIYKYKENIKIWPDLESNIKNYMKDIPNIAIYFQFLIYFHIFPIELLFSRTLFLILLTGTLKFLWNNEFYFILHAHMLHDYILLIIKIIVFL